MEITVINYEIIDRKHIAHSTAKSLLEVGAVYFSKEQPFHFTSGLASPVYIDCRKVIAFPQIRKILLNFMELILQDEVGFDNFDSVVGGETAGIPFAAWLASELNMPMHYIRKKPKGYARDAQIEGDLSEAERVLLVEDLTTDGASKIRFCNGLRKAGAIVEHTVMIFFYDIFPETRHSLNEQNLTLHALATWRDILEVSKQTNAFDNMTLNEIENFLDAPLKWSGDHGGASSLNL